VVAITYVKILPGVVTDMALIAICLLLAVSECALASGPVIKGITVEPKRAGRYEKVEVTFTLSRAYKNPFDPEQIDVSAEIRAPSGRRIVVPSFPYQGYGVSRQGRRENLEPVGDLVWKVRLAPIEVGRHRLRLRARDAEGVSQSEELAFEVLAGRGDGFIRRSAQVPRGFQFDSGKAYFAIGENVCWPRQAAPLRDYETWFDHLSEANCNYARLWLAGPFIATAPIHSTDDPKEVGPDRYSQRSSWRLDQVIELAERRGIYLMLCLDSFNSLRTRQPYPAFDQYPLNAKFGGPLRSPDEFFSNPQARKLFRQRLRYYVARWGYSTHVFAWEFWNEVDIIDHYDAAQVARWHRDMARHLRSLDPWRHLITTSFSGSEGDPAVDGLPEMDFVQTHCYGPRDTAGALVSWSRDKAAKYNKPHLVGEFGADALGQNDAKDVEGVHLHNGIWATALCGDAGTAMTWWWDSYIEPRNLYHHFAALARFVKGVDWIKGGFVPAKVESVARPPGTPAQLTDLTVRPTIASWEEHPANQPRDYQVGRDGVIRDCDKLSAVLHGIVNHPRQHNPPTFVVDYPAAGAFEVVIDGVSGWGGANLSIRLDGEQKLSADFPDNAPDDHETMHHYDGAYRIAVSPGPHRITVENSGADWSFVSYRFVGYVTAPDLRVVGLANRHCALLWSQNKANTWWNAIRGIKVKPLPPACVTVAGLADGDYRVEWWDTYAGAVTSTAKAQARGGRITVTTPEVPRDIACKVLRPLPRRR
jgi:hypothetical protein